MISRFVVVTSPCTHTVAGEPDATLTVADSGHEQTVSPLTATGLHALTSVRFNANASPAFSTTQSLVHIAPACVPEVEPEPKFPLKA